ncbi:conserved hypothetical protein [Paenibacillus curdlanolyticus YK9]|uniref:CD-NTase associated protein 4-like DNA endonuclease domain-containing protein n=1 Tax=Paenibacillus curdlanolyticus YK9 TaxID=717606 RepID=E0ICT9_9BACL|nr:hypothetical protein [Paenibacillus curdlanolyticus]EFM09975.1 conserved hypothetical protein [Paenibacillus curdlanolyticus YK9]
MAYTVTSSERLRPSGAEYETKALLYLMNFRNDSNDIYFFVVDFFNDLTGMDKMGTKLWDMQSKGAKTTSPKAIGKELVTLFKNFRSEMKFSYFLLFMGGVSNTVRLNNTINIFDISNIKPEAINKIKEGLLEESKEKTYIDHHSITDEEINTFLGKVQFIIDDKKPSEYVKSIVNVHPRIIPNEDTLNAIFNEIRDQQSSKKNIGVVENITIETSSEALDFCHHLTSSEIKLLVLGRIINRNPFDKGLPISFMSTLNRAPEEKRRSVLEDCQIALSRALFNKNRADDFWSLFENIYSIISSNPHDNLNMILSKLDNEFVNRSDFDAISLKYFISIVKDGIQ